MTDGPAPTTVTTIPCLNYRDADAALAWLCRCFGLTEHAVYRGEDGRVAHAELTFGHGMIMLGPSDKGDFARRFMTNPIAAGGRCTQAIYCIVADADVHHARAVAAGAEIVMPLRDEDYGGRGYAARDPDGHVWSFGTYDPWAPRKP